MQEVFTILPVIPQLPTFILYFLSFAFFLCFFKTPYNPYLSYIYTFFYLTSPVLAAAPDIKHPFSRISPLTPPILPKNRPQLGEILQNAPLFYPKIIKNPTFYPLNPQKPRFSLKKPPKPLFFPIFHTFSSKIQDFLDI